MRLGNRAIFEAFQTGGIRGGRGDNDIALSYQDFRVQENSIDVTLHKVMLQADLREAIDPYQHVTVPTKPVQLMRRHRPPGIDEDGKPRFYLPYDRASFFCEPGHLYYGSVNEWFDCKDVDHDVSLVQDIDGRSTVGRMGVQVHVTAGRGDVGFNGCFTLEITVKYPVILDPGMRIAQIYFEEVRDCGTRYSGAYSQGHRNGPVPPKLGIARFT